MNKYRPPRCKCGKALILEMETTTRHKIGSDGKRKPPYDGESEYWLTCKPCGAVYEKDYDNQNREIRGEIL